MAFIIPSHFRNVPNNFLIRLLGLKPWLKSITLGSDFFHLAKVFATANSDQGLALHLEHRFLTSSHALLVMKSVCFAKEIPTLSCMDPNGEQEVRTPPPSLESPNYTLFSSYTAPNLSKLTATKPAFNVGP